MSAGLEIRIELTARTPLERSGQTVVVPPALTFMWTPARMLTTLIAIALELVAASASGMSAQFNPLHHLGAASPYFDAPSQFGISSSTPARCSVDQAAYILRHGS